MLGEMSAKMSIAQYQKLGILRDFHRVGSSDEALTGSMSWERLTMPRPGELTPAIALPV
ncbi:hypothetical protein ACPOL_3237 [Acidisarcina polymorpha]|uniref:Uncharacterized protein n=2 Tax=Acidisarcina polymorpha TaxID=2211140 RepID=A0A2Z5G0B2_9BACT|nr:hypothetical protein ACPOL_3237 [Acidisarcina polymorpha]